MASKSLQDRRRPQHHSNPAASRMPVQEFRPSGMILVELPKCFKFSQGQPGNPVGDWAVQGAVIIDY